jgi:RimJ/RimL family protein N-acetyltransferase
MKRIDARRFLGNLLPRSAVQFTDMVPRESAQCASWIRSGRGDHVFRGGGGPTPRSLLEHQAHLRARLDDYRCLMVHTEGELAGFVDFGRSGRAGELLGVFIEPRWRKHRLGALAMRYAMACLRLQGARSVSCGVYDWNLPSVRACRRAGFLQTGRTSKDEHGTIAKFARALTPAERIAPSDRRYVDLQGDNAFVYHLAVADSLASALASMDGVQAVLGLGSLARGFGDGWSDIDIGVLAKSGTANRFWRGERWIAGVSIDLYAIDLDMMPPMAWDHARRQAFEESIVLAEKTPGEAGRVLRPTRLKQVERRQEITKLVFQMGWLGFMPRAWRHENRLGYRWAQPSDLWLRRGHLASAHLTVDRAADMLMQILFLLNKRFVPYAKWRRFLVGGLSSLPGPFEQRMRCIDVTPRSRSGFYIRAQALLDLVDEVSLRLTRAGLLAGNVYARFVEESTDYDPRA